MAHAHPDPRSFGLDTGTLPSKSRDRQAADARAAYIARVVDEAPPLTPAQIDGLAGIFAPHVHRLNATPAISMTAYQSLEIKRHLDAENPGRHGFFTSEDAA